MAEATKDAEENPIQGLSIVDSLTTNTATQEDVPDKTIVESVVAAKLDQIPPNAEVSDEEQGKAEDADDTIVLDEIDRRDDKEPNQSTLIITTEDILDSTTFDDTIIIAKIVEAKEEEEEKEKPAPIEPIVEDQKKIVKPNKPKRDDHHSYFWVSNISRQVKAADLKKFFSQIGKVSTAKILTNGKNYFGYVSMSSSELAGKCIKQLNNTTFDGKKITVSKDRPDLKETKSAVKVEPKKKKVESSKEEATKLSTEVRQKKIDEDHIAQCNSTIEDLKRKLDRAKTDANRYKFKVLEFQRRHEGMRKKCETLERELKDTQYKLRNERRRLNQDREQFEKTKKLEQIRFDADRAIVNKELDEVKKLREHLKEKIEEFKVQSKKVVKRRSRSPPVARGRNIRTRSPPMRGNANHVFRGEDKKRKREDMSRGRTPPPPPKLSDVVGKKRGDRTPESLTTNRAYFADDKRPMHEFDFRHKPGYGLPQDEMRGSWLNPFPKDPRRVGTGPSSSQSYQPETRYGGGYQFPSANVSAPPRTYYPEFGKNYGSY